MADDAWRPGQEPAHTVRLQPVGWVYSSGSMDSSGLCATCRVDPDPAEPVTREYETLCRQATAGTRVKATTVGLVHEQRPVEER